MIEKSVMKGLSGNVDNAYLDACPGQVDFAQDKVITPARPHLRKILISGRVLSLLLQSRPPPCDAHIQLHTKFFHRIALQPKTWCGSINVKVSS